MAFRAILFDKDGTLLDFNATWLPFARVAALEAADGDKVRATELLDLIGFDPAIPGFRPGSAVAAGTNREVVELLYPALAGDALRDKVAAIDAQTAAIARSDAVALPGVIDALGSLHMSGFRLGLATNDSTTGAEQTLLAFGIAQMFDAAFGYDAVATPKPAPDMLHAFCDLTGFKTSEIVVVGDNRHDLEMARAGGAGLAVGVLSGTGTAEVLGGLADVILDSVASLPDFLSGR